MPPLLEPVAACQHRRPNSTTRASSPRLVATCRSLSSSPPRLPLNQSRAALVECARGAGLGVGDDRHRGGPDEPDEREWPAIAILPRGRWARAPLLLPLAVRNSHKQLRQPIKFVAVHPPFPNPSHLKFPHLPSSLPNPSVGSSDHCTTGNQGFSSRRLFLPA